MKILFIHAGEALSNTENESSRLWQKLHDVNI